MIEYSDSFNDIEKLKRENEDLTMIVEKLTLEKETLINQ